MMEAVRTREAGTSKIGCGRIGWINQGQTDFRDHDTELLDQTVINLLMS
jgi:hypothetical protein